MIVVGLCLVEKLGELGAGNNALAGLVKIDTHYVTAANLHIDTLLTEGYQQILGISAETIHFLNLRFQQISDR